MSEVIRHGATRILAADDAWPDEVADLIVLATTPLQEFAVPGHQGALYDPVPPYRDAGASMSGYKFDPDVKHLFIWGSRNPPTIVQDGSTLVLLRQNEARTITGEVFTNVQMFQFKREFRGEESSQYIALRYKTAYSIREGHDTARPE